MKRQKEKRKNGQKKTAWKVVHIESETDIQREIDHLRWVMGPWLQSTFHSSPAPCLYQYLSFKTRAHIFIYVKFTSLCGIISVYHTLTYTNKPSLVNDERIELDNIYLLKLSLVAIIFKEKIGDLTKMKFFDQNLPRCDMLFLDIQNGVIFVTFFFLPFCFCFSYW